MAVARFNRQFTNRLTGAIAGWAPGFGIVIHRGRTSGREYRTPLNVFKRPGGYAIALTYGPESQYVRNVLAAGGCEIETSRKRVRLTNPRIVHDARRRFVPPPVRVILGLLGVDNFLLLDE